MAFIPHLVERGIGAVCIKVYTCAHCKRTMLKNDRGDYPTWKHTLAEQLKAANWSVRSTAQNAAGEDLCVDCAVEHSAFVCALCKQTRKGNPKESIGDPTEYLCTPCYETVPAKVWDEKVDALREEHRYDFE